MDSEKVAVHAETFPTPDNAGSASTTATTPIIEPLGDHRNDDEDDDDAEYLSSQAPSSEAQDPSKVPKIGNKRMQSGIQYIEDKSKRHITFSKRKAGIMKKATELAVLTGAQIIVAIASEASVYHLSTPKLTSFAKSDDFRNRLTELLYHYGPSVCDVMDPSSITVDKFQFRVQSRRCYYNAPNAQRPKSDKSRTNRQCSVCGEVQDGIIERHRLDCSRMRNANQIAGSDVYKGSDKPVDTLPKISEGSGMAENVEKVPYAVTQYMTYPSNESGSPSQTVPLQFAETRGTVYASSMSLPVHGQNVAAPVALIQQSHPMTGRRSQAYVSGDNYYGYSGVPMPNNEPVYYASAQGTSSFRGNTSNHLRDGNFYNQPANFDAPSRTTAHYNHEVPASSAAHPSVAPHMRHVMFPVAGENIDGGFSRRLTTTDGGYYSIQEAQPVSNAYNGFSVHSAFQNAPVVVSGAGYGSVADSEAAGVPYGHRVQQHSHMSTRAATDVQHHQQGLVARNDRDVPLVAQHQVVGQKLPFAKIDDNDAGRVGSRLGQGFGLTHGVAIESGTKQISTNAAMALPVHPNDATNIHSPTSAPGEIQRPYKSLSSMIFSSKGS